MTAVAPLARIEGLRHGFAGRAALTDISADIRPGIITGLVGPDGAGKTTAFYMIVGLVQSDAGSVRLDDVDLTGLPMHRRAQQGIGYLPQEASVFRRLSVEDNIRAILETRRELNATSRNARLEELLDELHLGRIRASAGQSLSGGERRRVEIARALAANPRFMLLDEPFAGVDPLSVIDIQRLITGLAARGIGVLITDHNVRETLGVCQRAYIVDRGTVLASGTADEILANERVREVYLGENFRM